MNDKEFRQKCRKISYANIEDYMQDRQYLVSTRKQDVDVLKTAALLYIAANMPNFNDEKKKQEIGKCSFCSRGKIVLRSFESKKTDEVFTEVFTDLLFDPKNRTLSINNDIAGFIGPMNIAYCPMCGRKL